MNSLEVALNLWYVTETNYVFLLMGRAYAVIGTQEEKMAILKERSLFDWQIAEQFNVPDKYRSYIEGLGYMNAIQVEDVEDIGGLLEIFQDVIEVLKSQMGKYNQLKLPENPIYLITEVPHITDLDYKIEGLDEQ